MSCLEKDLGYIRYKHLSLFLYRDTVCKTHRSLHFLRLLDYYLPFILSIR